MSPKKKASYAHALSKHFNFPPANFNEIFNQSAFDVKACELLTTLMYCEMYIIADLI